MYQVSGFMSVEARYMSPKKPPPPIRKTNCSRSEPERPHLMQFSRNKLSWAVRQKSLKAPEPGQQSGSTTRPGSAPRLLQLGFFVVVAVIIWCAVLLDQVILAPRALALRAEFSFPNHEFDSVTDAVLSNAEMHLLAFLVLLFILPTKFQSCRKDSNTIMGSLTISGFWYSFTVVRSLDSNGNCIQ